MRPLPQAHTEAGLPFRCACCTSWSTPPAGWETPHCLCGTSPSFCRPCWTSCLTRVSEFVLFSFQGALVVAWGMGSLHFQLRAGGGYLFLLLAILPMFPLVYPCKTPKTEGAPAPHAPEGDTQITLEKRSRCNSMRISLFQNSGFHSHEYSLVPGASWIQDLFLETAPLAWKTEC